VPGSSNPFLQKYYHQHGGGGYDAIFSFFDLDSDELVEVPKAAAHTCHLQGGYDPENWQLLGATSESFRISQESEAFIADRGVQILKTCTPYLAGNVPSKGDHCAWMESSAVVYCNSVIGARTNTEGRESTSAAMLTGRIPDWGFHRDENRFGSHLIEVDFPIESVMDWGMLGYFAGEAVGERIPVLTGEFGSADLIRHKHFGAAAASSGGVEMYHIVGVTPEARTLAEAFGGRKPLHIIPYGLAEKRLTYDNLNSKASDPQVDYVMLGCPHYSIDQIRDACRMLEGKRVSANCNLWIFTSRAVKATADAQGLSKQLRSAGAVLLTDTCSSISQAVPPGTKVAALDSAKQTHYLPAIMNIQAWFGSTQDCIQAATTGRWNGVRP
jgi:predicted aconitase